MADWNNPSTSQTHSNELASTKARDESNAIMDYSADSNIPDGTIRWNSTSSRFEIWDTGSGSWGELDTEYAINVSNAVEADNLDGRDAGNSSDDVPISNGSLNSNLNADFLDGEHGAYYNDTPNGTTMLFYQASAPTGWTQDTSVNDRVLRVVSGSGGGSGGSWTISGLNVQGHALTEAEMPSHNHGNGSLSADGNGSHNHGDNTGNASGDIQIYEASGQSGGDDFGVATEVRSENLWSGSRARESGSHNHHIPTDGFHGHNISGSTSNAGSDSPHDHGIDHNGSWRPSHIDVIAATRSK